MRKDDMAQEVTNFAQFYAVQQAALYRRPGRIQEKHCAAVRGADGQSEGNDSKEYEACCMALKKLSGQDEWRQKLREELRRRKRSLPEPDASWA